MSDRSLYFRGATTPGSVFYMMDHMNILIYPPYHNIMEIEMNQIFYEVIYW